MTLGPPVPGDARRGEGDHSEGRRGHGRVQHPVRHRSRDGAPRRHRDEPARFALLGARVQGDGVPIAKIAALLAVGYRLDEIANDITKKTPACFEPSLDYVVVKIPRWTFEKFPKADPRLSIQMKSVGEAMAIGRTFAEALGKAIRSLEIGRDGLDDGGGPLPREELLEKLSVPTWERIFHLRRAFVAGMTVEEIAAATRIDPWFLDAIRNMVATESSFSGRRLADVSAESWRGAKRLGLSDRSLARVLSAEESGVRERRQALGVSPVFKTIDTCAAEFEAETPYFYSTYEDENESLRTAKKKIVILGGGPTASGRGSSSTTAASTPATRSPRRATRP
jgi:carbamoyl-phosphate synthase large subunit